MNNKMIKYFLIILLVLSVLSTAVQVMNVAMEISENNLENECTGQLIYSKGIVYCNVDIPNGVSSTGTAIYAGDPGSNLLISIILTGIIIVNLYQLKDEVVVKGK